MTDRRGALASLILLVGCAGGSDPDPDALHGYRLPSATPRPEFALTTVAGDGFDFAEATKGRLTLLFFGYTNCPDVCPATMANLGAVLGKLTGEERRRIDVVFVTTDPDRDRPEVLGPWLARFDRDFVGLVGSIDEVIAAQRASGIEAAVKDGEGEGYTVSHAAQVIVVSPDDSVHLHYPFGTRQAEWASDVPRLLRSFGGSAR
ncbi:MAG: SCO family protein [Gemmatimonadales bacterium]